MARFYLDEDVSVPIADILQAAGHQAVAAIQMGWDGLKDPDQLLNAARRNWIVVTHNRRDFEMLHRAGLLWSTEWAVVRPHSGILILPQATPAEQAAGRMGDIDLAQLLIDMAATDAPQPNELWHWRRLDGWVRDESLT